MTDVKTDVTTDVIEAPYPFQIHLGFEVTEWTREYTILDLPLKELHGNRFGIPHGGLYGCLLDTAMGYAAAWTGDPAVTQQVVTLTLNVHFLAQPQGSRLITKGWTTGGGRRTIFAQGEVHDDLGTLIATGTGAFKMRG